MANIDRIAHLAQLEGVFPVDKPRDVPFQEVVYTVKRKFNLVKVSHGGSLDASASGVFLVLVGDASRIAQSLMCADKTYSAVLRLGVSTDTCDIHGRVVSTGAVAAAMADRAAVEAAISAQFLGDAFETRPDFSAILRNGSTSYEVVPTPGGKPRLVHWYRIAVRSYEPPLLELDMKCAKDASPRAFAGALGAELGCGAVLESLCREAHGGFSKADAVPYEKVLTMDPMDFAARVVSVPEAVRR